MVRMRWSQWPLAVMMIADVVYCDAAFFFVFLALQCA